MRKAAIVIESGGSEIVKWMTRSASPEKALSISACFLVLATWSSTATANLFILNFILKWETVQIWEILRAQFSRQRSIRSPAANMALRGGCRVWSRMAGESENFWVKACRKSSGTANPWCSFHSSSNWKNRSSSTEEQYKIYKAWFLLGQRGSTGLLLP